jgi:hypothetical protein
MYLNLPVRAAFKIGVALVDPAYACNQKFTALPSQQLEKTEQYFVIINP